MKKPFLISLVTVSIGFLSAVSQANDCVMQEKLTPWFMPSGASAGQMYYFPIKDVDFYSDSDLGLFDLSYTVKGQRQRLCRGDQPCSVNVTATKEWVRNMPNDKNVLVFSTTFVDSTGTPGWQRNVFVSHPDSGYITIAHSTGSGQMSLEATTASEFSITCYTGA